MKFHIPLFPVQRRSLVEVAWFLFRLPLHLVLPIHQRVIARRQAKSLRSVSIEAIEVSAVAISPSEEASRPIHEPVPPPPPSTTVESIPFPQVTEQPITPVRFTDPPFPAVVTQPSLEPIHSPEPSEMSRTTLVTRLLDEAWGQGYTTYPDLIGYVKQQSGTGCSKRFVAAWKRSRGLIGETPFTNGCDSSQSERDPDCSFPHPKYPIQNPQWDDAA
ncbi:MAG TPA: hypothetical protein V6C65_21450 [Allocoleopsis sp.]